MIDSIFEETRHLNNTKNTKTLLWYWFSTDIEHSSYKELSSLRAPRVTFLAELSMQRYCFPCLSGDMIALFTSPISRLKWFLWRLWHSTNTQFSTTKMPPDVPIYHCSKKRSALFSINDIAVRCLSWLLGRTQATDLLPGRFVVLAVKRGGEEHVIIW